MEKYFQKFFQNEELFRRAYVCVRANKTLITACSIPVICWIICTVMRERFSDGADVTSGLETTSSVYVDFVSTLLETSLPGFESVCPEPAEEFWVSWQREGCWNNKCCLRRNVFMKQCQTLLAIYSCASSSLREKSAERRCSVSYIAAFRSSSLLSTMSFWMKKSQRGKWQCCFTL